MARSKWIPTFAQQQLQTNQAAQAAALSASSNAEVPSDAKKFGLENFGNTCYANSVLQALYFCTPFRDLLLQAPDPSLPPPDPVPATLPPPPPPPPAEPATPLIPVRRKPERKASTSGQPLPALTTAVPPAAPPAPPPIPANPATLFSALRSLFTYISSSPGEKGTVAPRAFIDKLKDLNESFRSTMHQDAHEFLNYLLNRIVEEIEEDRKHASTNGTTGSNNPDDLSSSIGTLPPPPPTIQSSSNSGTAPQDATLVHKLFEGVLTSETRCLSCETVSSRDESFLDLSIDIEQNSSVTACLRQFSASEMLCRGNKFSCDSCGGLQEAEKRMKIKRLPNVLALHLKRFKYQEDVQKYIKLTYRVAFPFELRLFNTVDDLGDDADRLYNLFAIVVHIGTGPHHGHYVSIIKTASTWLVFDDDNVYPIVENDIPKYFGESNSGSAYVLYYQAADINLVSLGLQLPSPPTSPPEESISVPPNTAVAADSSSPAPPVPPGLAPTPVATPSEDAASEASADKPIFSSPFSASPAPASPAPPAMLINALAPLQISVAESSASTRTSSSTTSGGMGPDLVPMTPTGKGGKLFGGLRRAPSISAKGVGSNGLDGAAGSRSVNGGAEKRSVSEKTPRASASTPAVHVVPPHGNVVLEPLPPLPPTPAALQISKSLPLQVNGKDKEREGGKEKKEKKEKGSNWFGKRKSFRLGDKDKDREKGRSGGEEEPSPVHLHHREAHSSPSSAASNWFKTAGHYQTKEKSKHGRPSPSEAGGYAVIRGAEAAGVGAGTFTPELSGASAPPDPPTARPKSSTAGLGSYHHQQQYQGNGYEDPPTPHSSSSGSTSFGHVLPPPPGAAPSSAPSGSASPMSQPLLDFPPPRMTSLHPSASDSEQSQRSTASEHHRSRSTNTSRKPRDPPPPVMSPRPSTAAAAPLVPNRRTDSERRLPTLPPTPQHERHGSAVNGWSAEPENLYAAPAGGGKGKTRSTDGEHDAASYTTASTTDPLLRSGTGAGGSSVGSHSYNNTGPPVSGMKRATRKLSLTAPMLGFGRRDRDKDKDKEREKDKAPSTFGRF